MLRCLHASVGSSWRPLPKARGTSFLDSEGSAAVLTALGPGFDEGALRAPAIAEHSPLEQAGTAYARVESGEAAGRVLLVVG